MPEDNVLYGEKLDTNIGVTLGQLLQVSLKNHKNKLLQVDALTGEELSASRLLHLATRVSSWLQSQGIGPGDTISICSENRLEFTVVFCSLLLLGATVVPINPDYTQDEIKRIVNISQPKIIFTSCKGYNNILAVAKQYSHVKAVVLFGDHIANITTCLTLCQILDETTYDRHFESPKLDVHTNIAAIMSSSGTTGLPKGVMITQHNIITLICIMKKLAFYKQEEIPTEISTGLVPFFHSMGLLINLLDILVANKMILMRKFDLPKLLSIIQDYRVTTLLTPPPVILMLCKYPLIDNYDLSSLKKVRISAAPITKEVQEYIYKKFNLEEVTQAYGLTESTLGVLLAPTRNKFGTVGQIVPGMKVKVIDESGRALGAHQEGELCFSGPLIMKGYIRDSTATASTVHSGNWLHTGDVGYYDNEGYFYVVDRLKELIKFKGFQVSPAELEGILLEHPAVADAAVVGLPDEMAGELPLAYIVLKPGANASATEIQNFVNDKVSPQKRLRGGVRFIESIPRNTTGKILRRLLRNKSKL